MHRILFNFYKGLSSTIPNWMLTLYDFFSLSFKLRTIYSYSLETNITAIFGRETEIQNGVKDEFAEATEKGFKGQETDVPATVNVPIIQSG